MAKVHRTKRQQAGEKPVTGRPETVPSEEQTGVITSVLMNFGTAAEAYTMARVPSSTYYLWLEKGKSARAAGKTGGRDKETLKPLPGFDPFLEFLEKVEQADAGSTVAMLTNITKAAKEPRNWQAALALLKIKNPRRFGERLRVHVEAEFDEFLDRLEKKLSPELFEQVYLAAYAEGADGEESGEDPRVPPPQEA